MFNNILKIAFRNIWRNKVFSLINIVGLSIGLSASFVIGIIIYYDVTFDKFHPDGERMHRITTTLSSNDDSFSTRGVAIPLGLKVKEGMAGIEKATTFYSTNFRKITSESENYIYKNTTDIIYTDASYFNFFNYRWLTGKPRSVLDNPNEVVLTSTRAAKYFPKLSLDQIVGKTLIYNDSINVKVVGVVSAFKERTDLNFQEFLSYKTAISAGAENQVLNRNWNSTNSASQLFIIVQNNGMLPQIQQALDQLAKEHADKEMVSMGYGRQFDIQSLSDLHFNQDVGTFNFLERTADKTVLLGLSLTAFFLLLLGCINFINLNTAQASKRAKEIGIRKTLGSSRKLIIFQFIGETTILTMAAGLISLLLCPLWIKMFSDFIPKGISLDLMANMWIIGFVLLLLAVVALFSGIYPAMILSKFRPIQVLKGQIFQVESKSVVRKYLTIFQFTIAQIFILATLIVGQQLNFMLNKEMGFKTNAIAYIRA